MLLSLPSSPLYGRRKLEKVIKDTQERLNTVRMQLQEAQQKAQAGTVAAAAARGGAG